MANIDICKTVYNNFYRTVADSLTEVLAYFPMIQLDTTMEE